MGKRHLTFLALGVLMAQPAMAAQSPAGSSPAVAAQAAGPSAARRALNLRVFDQVWGRVDKTYYDPRFGGVDWRAARVRFRPLAEKAPDEESLYVVLEQMLGLLNDQHAVATSPALRARRATRTETKAGFGAWFRREGGAYVVADVWPGGPAEAAGVQPDWRIELVDGQPFGPSFRPVEGTAHRATLRDPQGAVHEVVMTARVLTPPQENRVYQARPGVFVVQFQNFDSGRSAWLYEAMNQVPPDAALVLDLRANNGGLIREMSRSLSCFLPPDRPFAEAVPRKGRKGVWTVQAGCPRIFTGPVAALVDRNSASGAEILPAVLRQAGRASVVGQRTSGAVLASMNYPLPDGGDVRLSVNDLVINGSQRLERVGLEPDVQAITTYADRRAGRDPALDVAIERVLSRSKAT